MGICRTSLPGLVFVTAALAGGVMAPPIAEAQEEGRVQVFRFDIEAASLSEVLSRFSEASRLQLVYTSDLVKGLRSPGLKGEYSAADALTRILAGSGLTYQMTSNKTIALLPGPSKGTRTLGPVRVEGQEARSAVNGANGSRDV